MSPAESASNGRVTMAVIATKLDRLLAENEKLLQRFDRHLEQSSERDRKISLLEQRTQISQGDISELETEVKTIARRSYTLDGLVAAIAALGSAIAAWWGSK